MPRILVKDLLPPPETYRSCIILVGCGNDDNVYNLPTVYEYTAGGDNSWSFISTTISNNELVQTPMNITANLFMHIDDYEQVILLCTDLNGIVKVLPFSTYARTT